MNRHVLGIILTLIIALLSACQSADEVSPTITAEETAVAQASLLPPTETPEPTAVPADQWQVVAQLKPEHEPKYAAFINELFGVTGCGKDGRPFFTADGGQSWIQPAMGQFCPSSIEIVDGRSVWLCNSFGVFNSQDGGRTVTQWYNPYDGCRLMSFSDQNNGWSSFEWNIAATEDGAIRWVDLEKDYTMGEIAAIALRSPVNGYVLTYDGFLFKTTDGGASWSSVKMSLADNDLAIANMDGRPPIVMRFMDEQNGIIVANLTDRGLGRIEVWQTADGGQTWDEKLLPLNPGAVYLSHDGQYLTVTEHGGAGGITILKNQALEE